MFQNPPTSEKLIEAILIKTKVKQLDIIATLPKAAPVKKKITEYILPFLPHNIICSQFIYFVGAEVNTQGLRRVGSSSSPLADTIVNQGVTSVVCH